MKPRSKVTRCKINGCKGKPKKNGLYPKGFCAAHNRQYALKKIDINGKPLPQDDSDRKQRDEFNKLMRRAASVDKDVRILNARIHENRKSPKSRFHKPHNQAVPGLVDGMRAMGEHIRKKDFVFGNIEEMNNTTLQRVLRPTLPVPAFDTGIPGVDAYDVVQIVKLLRRGYGLKNIKKLYASVSIAKLRKVREKYDNGEYPIPEDV